MSGGALNVTLPEDLVLLVCDHYASQRQLGSLARLMTLNQRTSVYVRKLLYRRFAFVDDRSSRYLGTANDISEKYDDGDALDEDILAAIDCREVDPLDLDPDVRWLRNFRMVEVIEIKDMLYGRDIDSLHAIAQSLAKRELLLFPKLRQVIIHPQVTRRIHSAEAKYPKRTPMALLVLIFLGSNIRSLTIGDSTLFTPPPNTRSMMYMDLSRILPVNGRLPPGHNAHISHATIQFIQGMHTLHTVTYLKVDPYVPIRPKRGIKHIVSFRPMPPPPLYTPPRPSTSIAHPFHSQLRDREGTTVDERGYIWEIRQAMIDIIHRSVVPLDPEPDHSIAESESDSEGEGEGEVERAEGTRRRSLSEVLARQRRRDRRIRERETRSQVGRFEPAIGAGAGAAAGAEAEAGASDGAQAEIIKRPESTNTRNQSSWHFILPFGSESSTPASTLKMQVRDMVRRKYTDEGLVDEVLGGLSFEFNEM